MNPTPNEALRARVAEAVANGESLANVAREFSVSRERVRQIKNELLVGKREINIPYWEVRQEKRLSRKLAEQEQRTKYFPHGTLRRYTRGCRCDACREANNVATKQYRELRRQRLLEDPTLAPHGRPSTYNNWLCRCEPCTEANTASTNTYYASKKGINSE